MVYSHQLVLSGDISLLRRSPWCLCEAERRRVFLVDRVPQHFPAASASAVPPAEPPDVGAQLVQPLPNLPKQPMRGIKLEKLMFSELIFDLSATHLSW